jgi:hypothetical protein
MMRNRPVRLIMSFWPREDVRTLLAQLIIMDQIVSVHWWRKTNICLQDWFVKFGLICKESQNQTVRLSMNGYLGSLLYSNAEVLLPPYAMSPASPRPGTI